MLYVQSSNITQPQQKKDREKSTLLLNTFGWRSESEKEHVLHNLENVDNHNN